MGEVSKGEGRTVLFVSHNMHAVSELCSKGIVLNQGEVVVNSTVEDSIKYYQNHQLQFLNNSWERNQKISKPSFSHISLDLNGKQPNYLLRIKFKVNVQPNVLPAYVAFGIKNSIGVTVMEAFPSFKQFINFSDEDRIYECEIDLNNLVPDVYGIYVWLGASEMIMYDWVDNELGFEIFDSPTPERTFPFVASAGSISADARLL